MKKQKIRRKENKKMKKNELGITLIALVVTIVVLLILAGVSISLVLGENGIINKAKEAGEKYGEAYENEQAELNKVDEWLEENTGSPYKPMITKWNIESGNEVRMYLYAPTDYANNPLENLTNVTIDWGDGSKETYTSSNLQYENGEGYVTHTYQNSNSETLIEILGECNTIGMSENSQLISIEDWGYTGSQGYYFGYCENLTTIASPRPNTFKNVISFKSTFAGCTSLTSIPADLFANCTQVEVFTWTFRGCTSLTSIPADLFANCTQVESFLGTFGGCINLTGEPIPLWERVPNGSENGYEGIPDGAGCYAKCTKLTNYESIPELWTDDSK